eukprot:s6006_g1.t1
MPLPRTAKWLNPWSMSNAAEWPVYWHILLTYIYHVVRSDGLLGGACARDLNGTGDGRSSLCVLGCPGTAKTFALWCFLLCLDAALDHRVLWTSQQHSGLFAVVGIATNLLKDAPAMASAPPLGTGISQRTTTLPLLRQRYPRASASSRVAPLPRTHHDHPAVAELPSVKNARMLVLTQASCMPIASDLGPRCA